MNTEENQEEELTPEEIEAKEEAEFDAEFAGEDEPEAVEPTEEELVAIEAEEAVETVAETPPEPEDTVDRRLRKMEGKFGQVNAQLQEFIKAGSQVAAASPSVAPTQTQIKEAAKTEGGIEALREDFPVWADATLEAQERTKTELREEFQGLASQDYVEQKVASTFNHARQVALVDYKHPDWENTVKSEAFSEWAYEGGPSAEQVGQYNAYKQMSPAQADDYARQLLQAYPDWAGEKGNLVYSDKGSDAVKLLDGYEASKGVAPGPTGKRSRLERSVDATEGKGLPTTTSSSEEDDFLAAYGG